MDSINVPSARYIQGQSGIWELEFDSVLDHAVYFAGKSPFPKGAKQTEILDWLQDTLKLSWKQISDHREKILDKIRELTPKAWESGDYPYVRIPIVDIDFETNSYIQADEEDDDIPEGLDDLLGDIRVDDDEEDDDMPEGLDDLLGNIRVEEENNTDEKEVDEQAEIASKVLIEAEDAREQAIDESVLDDLPESLRAALVGVINKKTGTTIGGGETKTKSSYVSNNKIFKFLTTNLYKIQGQLDSIDRSLQDQTSIVQANLQVTSNIYENLNIQNQILGEKLDAILQAFNRQNDLAKKFADEEENRSAEQRLEGGMDAAGTETPVSTIGSGKGSSGNSLLRRLTKFFGRKLASQIFKRLPYGLKRKIVGLRKLKQLPGKLKAKVTSKITSKILQRVAPKIAIKPVQAVATRGVAKGFEHIALPGVTKAVQQADKPAAKVIEKSGEHILQRAFSSPIIQKAIIKVVGREGAEKLVAKISAKLIPGVSTAYGLGEGIARIGMGDVKGGFLSFGSAIPVAGYGFAAVDILRDINPDAYTKHIESNLPVPSNENFAAFFADALGVTEDQYETGGVTKPGLAMLHGTEAVVNKNALNTQAVDPVGGNILAATTQYINKLGPIGSSIAPTFKQVASPLAKVYGMPSTLVQTNVGGSLPSLQSTMRKVKEKRKLSLGEQLGAMETDLLKTTDPESFADKLLKMIDPEGKFQELLKKINNPSPPPPGGDGMATFGETGIDKGSGYNAKGFVHGHFQNSNKQALINDTFDVVKKLVTSDAKPSILGKILTKDMSDAEIKKYVEDGVGGHKAYDSGAFAVDVSVPTGTKVPVELENVYDSKGAGGIIGTMKGRTTQIMHLASGSKAGAAPASNEKLPPGQVPMGVTRNEASNITDTRNPGKLIIGAGHVDTPGKPGSGQGTASGDVRESAATQHMLQALKSLIKADPALKDKVEFSSFNNDNFAKDNADKYTNQGNQFLELHFDQRGGGGRSGLIPSRNARAGVTGNAGTSGFDVALSKRFGNFGSNFKKGDLGIPDTGGSILEFGAIDSNPALLKEIQSGNMGPETMKLARYTYDAVKAGATAEGWISPPATPSITPPTQRQPAQSKYYLRQGSDSNKDTQIIMIPASSSAGKSINKNATIEGQRFTYDANHNTFNTSEVASTTRALVLRRLGLN